MRELKTPPERYVHIFFMDGVGLGGPDPEVNAFARSEFGVTDFAVQPQVTTWTARLTLTF